MRRELRRHPVQAKPARTSNRGARMPRTTTPGTGVATRQKVRWLPGFLQPSWFLEVWSELKKVQWPTRQETLNLTLVVLVVATALGLFLGGIDAGFNWIIENVLLGVG